MVLQQNYSLDIGYIYHAVSYTAIQTVIIETVVNLSPLDVLQNLLPILSGQVFNYQNTCPLAKGIKPRTVEIELVDNTKYRFDISFNSASALWAQLLIELGNSAIASWEITGEKIPGYKLPLLLTKV